MAQLPNTAKVADIIASLQAVTGINQKDELAAALTLQGHVLTGSETMVDLIALVDSANTARLSLIISVNNILGG